MPMEVEYPLFVRCSFRLNLFQNSFAVSYSTSMNSSGYLTFPALSSNVLSVNSIAIKASSGTSNGHFILQFEALINPNFG